MRGVNVSCPCFFTKQKVKELEMKLFYEARQNVVKANLETKMT